MNTAAELKAHRAQLVIQRAECEQIGLTTAGVDMAIFNVDRQLQNLLGDDDADEEGYTVGMAIGDWGLAIVGLLLLCGAAWLGWGPR